MTAPPPPEDVEKVAQVWGDADFTRSLAEIHWMGSVVVRRYLNRLASGNEAVDWLTYLSQRYLRPRSRRVLVLGCGEGWLERSIAQDPSVEWIDAYDIAPEAVARAEEQARALGMTKIRYGVLDLNRDSLRENEYELVIAHSVLHHVENLEHAMPQIADALVSDGVLFVNEYVGPMRFQYSGRQMAIINDLLARLPERYRRSGVMREIYPHKTRPTIDEMIRTDPSEAVRSDEILPLLDRHFDVKESIRYGGTVLNHLLYDIVQNFREEEPDRTMIELLCLAEELLIYEGGLESDYALVVATRRDAPRDALPPVPCIQAAEKVPAPPRLLTRAVAHAGDVLFGLRTRRRQSDLRGTEHPVISRYLNANAASGDGATSWHDLVRHELANREDARVLVIGERIGEWSHWFAAQPQTASVDIALAPSRGSTRNVGRRSLDDLPPSHYDIVLSTGALSMLARPSDGVAAVFGSMQPGAVLLAEEYAGLPMRQLPASTADALARILALLPGSDDRSARRTLRRFARSLLTGGSFHAPELPEAIRRHFDDAEIRPYTSLLLQEVIASRPSLLTSRGEEEGVLDLICGIEKWLMDLGVITPDFVTIRATKR
jgi:SAM-dependent methyltransferase